MIAWLFESTRPDKKYTVIVDDGDTRRTIHFGQRGASDYTVHHDVERKQRYVLRHRAREDWNNPMTAGFWAHWLLWSEPSLKVAINKTSRRFGIRIIIGRPK